MTPTERQQALQLVQGSLNRVERWVEDANYRGYEPFDGLLSWFRPLTFGNIFAQRLLQQLVRQSPINLRPLFGIRPNDSTKGRGYMAAGYLLLHRTSGDPSYRTKADACLRWLDQNKVARFQHHAWSNCFDFASRSGIYTKDDPIIVWTSFIGQAYADAYELFGDPWYLEIARSTCGWVLRLPRETTPTGTCLSYLAHVQSSIHNSNLLGAAVLAKTYRHTREPELAEVARAAVEYSCTRQHPDGSWWYGEDPKYQWIDNFHTGYNLDCLRIYRDGTGDRSYDGHLRRGLDYFKYAFFEADGCPKYYHNRRYPVDIQCAAQAIDTLAFFADEDPECLDLAVKVARWTIDNMQEADGHFQYRHYPWGKMKTAMLHWGQATTFKGLAMLHSRLADISPSTIQNSVNGIHAKVKIR